MSVLTWAGESGQQPGTGGLPPGMKPAPSVKEPEYGLYAVVAGLAVLAALDGAALAVFGSNLSNVIGLIGAISSPIVAMVTAYFGIKVGAQAGSSSSAAAENARQKADNETKALLGQMPPDQALPAMRSLGIPVPGSSP